jgi:hypothetical protein
MAKFIRYALATVCFAASVGCLGLWWRSTTYFEKAAGPTYLFPQRALYVEYYRGIASTTFLDDPKGRLGGEGWEWLGSTSDDYKIYEFYDIKNKGLFGIHEKMPMAHFPLWYPALTFTLVGVGVLRFRRQFSIRTALICLTIVAALLGIVVIL